MITTPTEELVRMAWRTFELKGVCEKLGLIPNKKGELTKNE